MEVCVKNIHGKDPTHLATTDGHLPRIKQIKMADSLHSTDQM